MKSVLISIRPKWCELIAHREKTIEVRKTAPKEVPFKAYIYCTKAKRIGFDEFYADAIEADLPFGECGNGKVIGEFVCDKILEIDCDSVAPFDRETKEYIEDEICFCRDELIKYAGFTRPFGWHISDLVIYDKPKELSEFGHPCTLGKCPTYEECGGVDGSCVFAHHIRPPKSWCYVEELSNE